jgi:type III secretory pathway component EscU
MPCKKGGEHMPKTHRNQPPKRRFTERRKKKDWIVRTVTIMSIIGWLAVAVMFLLLDRAIPSKSRFSYTFFDAPALSPWNTAMLRISLIVLIFVLFVSIVGFIFNAARLRRKTDRVSKPLITLFVLSLISLIVYWLVFAKFL